MWDRAQLVETIRAQFKDRQLVIVSNREPFLHYYDGSKVKVKRSVGGVSIPFDSILRATHGLWVAYGGSEADKAVVDDNDEIKMPPGQKSYTLKRVWMNQKELDGYYRGFANGALWPLCHVAFVPPVFAESDWKDYKRINRRFATKILEAIGNRQAIVWIQDYHFALLAKYLRRARPDLLIGQFWHIPWPTHEVFRICPWSREILQGLLANDVLGFHRNYHISNFLRTVARELETNIDYDGRRVHHDGQTTQIVARPISVDALDIEERLTRSVGRKSSVLKRLKIKTEYLAVGVDRVDYTKGIPQRLQAIDRFLTEHPSFRGRFTYVGVATPSRGDVHGYDEVMSEIKTLAEDINARHRTKTWQPLHMLYEFVERDDVVMLLRDADVCLVTSLDDGMNLVAKEFVIANSRGSLVLSKFTGAAKDLQEALLVNPYDIGQVANAIHQGLMLKPSERKERLARMRERVRTNNLFRWTGKFLQAMADSGFRGAPTQKP